MTESLPLKDLLEFTRDGEWGQAEPCDDLMEMAVIRGTDFLSVRRGDTSTVPRRFIPRKAAERKALVPGDILIETAGGTKDQATGRTVYLTERLFEEFAVPVTCASFSRFLRVNRGLVNPRYLFWYLQSIYSTGEMLPYHIQHTGVARFQYTNFASECQVILPSLGEQGLIANTLSILDDKIELNRGMNETLEAMARAIFKDWFVDFGPTRAKVEGRAPYLTSDLWDLFPDALDDENKPVGWKFGTIGTLAKIKAGKRPSSKFSKPNGAHRVPVYGGNGISWYTHEPLYNPPFLITGRVGTLGTVFRVNESVWVSDNALCCFPIESKSFELLFFCLKSLDYDSLNAGSTQPLLTQTVLRAQRVMIGDQRVREAFSDCIRPLFSRAVHSTRESQTLAVVRDFLLPRLMSGEIRLREAEKAVEAVA